MSSKRSAGKNKTGNKNEKSKGSNIDIQDTKVGCNGLTAILFKHVYVFNYYYFDIN